MKNLADISLFESVQNNAVSVCNYLWFKPGWNPQNNQQTLQPTQVTIGSDGEKAILYAKQVSDEVENLRLVANGLRAMLEDYNHRTKTGDSIFETRRERAHADLRSAGNITAGHQIPASAKHLFSIIQKVERYCAGVIAGANRVIESTNAVRRFLKYAK